MVKIKVVVWDLDDTLWNGTVFYKDRNTITLKPGTKATLKELDKRGIKNSICSKNDAEDADQLLEKFGIKKYFEHSQISWSLKSDGIKKIAALFKVPYDEMLFVDDDAFQREEVLSQIPNIIVAQLADPLDILNLDGIMPEHPTDADKKRVEILRQQKTRETTEKSFKGDYKDFLRSCNIKMRVRDMEEQDLPRVVQLINRTNELNATGNRYELEKLKKSCESNTCKIIVAELSDKFGDYGLIAESVIETKPKEWFIKELAVSCRTMGRGIGSALVVSILNAAKNNGVERVEGYVKQTESNWRLTPLFEKRGFTKLSQHGLLTSYEFLIGKNKFPSYPAWIDVSTALKTPVYQKT